MFYIPVILGSTRRGRRSPRVARFMADRIRRSGRAEAEILDLLECDFPLMQERLSELGEPPPRLREFGERVARADAVVIVSPEYNGGYPGVLKNALDYLLPEYKRKPVGVVTVSVGGLGGYSCLSQLRQVLLSMGAVPIPALLPVSRVQDSFAEDGTPTDPAYERRAEGFITELIWFAEALSAQKAKSP